MGNIAVSRDLIRRIDDNHSLVQFVCEEARDLPQHRRLAHAGPPEEKDALPGAHQVLDDADRAKHGAADTAGETDDLALPIADARDAMQRALDAGAVVRVELADARDDVSRPLSNLSVAKDNLSG
jgi:hypothetical protein